MRMILFRGKRLDNGEWVVGDLVHNGKYCVVLPEKPESNAYLDYMVDPSTLGQYTGLQDKNGQLIFEGDILKVTWNAIDREPYSEIHLVKFCKGCFCVSFGERSRGLLSGYIGITGDGYGVIVEVIGNIHDNPELLEVNHEA